jgi:hypothetical protein
MGQLIRLEYRVLDNNEVTPNDHNELCDIARNIVNCGIGPNEPLLGMSPESEFKKLYDCCMDVLSRELQPILD